MHFIDNTKQHYRISARVQFLRYHIQKVMIIYLMAEVTMTRMTFRFGFRVLKRNRLLGSLLLLDDKPQYIFSIENIYKCADVYIVCQSFQKCTVHCKTVIRMQEGVTNSEQRYFVYRLHRCVYLVFLCKIFFIFMLLLFLVLTHEYKKVRIRLLYDLLSALH